MRKQDPGAKLDAIDRALLEVLQVDAKLTNLELAERVHLSPSACLRRVKALEESGVIAQYVALIDPKTVGRHGTSYTIVNLEKLTRSTMDTFEQAIRAVPVPDVVWITCTTTGMRSSVVGA